MSNETFIVDKSGKAFGATYYQSKIQCPAHYLIDPKEDIYLREIDPMLKGVSKSACITYGISKLRMKRDVFGNKLLDWKKLYRLKKEGKVIQPFISSSFAIENVYDPKSPVCIRCRGRCKEGKGKIKTTTIKRLMG